MEKISIKDGEEFRIQLKEFKGHTFIDIRKYFLTEEGKWQYTTKGISVSPRLWNEFLSVLTNFDITKLEKGEDIE